MKTLIIVLCLLVSGCGTVKGTLTLAEGIGKDLSAAAKYTNSHIHKEAKNDARPTSLTQYCND